MMMKKSADIDLTATPYAEGKNCVENDELNLNLRRVAFICAHPFLIPCENIIVRSIQACEHELLPTRFDSQVNNQMKI